MVAAAPLPLPQKWDENEWFVLGINLLGILALSLLAKRFPKCISILIFIYCISVVRGVDDIIAGPPYDLYDINDVPEWELMDLLVYFFYGYFGILFLALYDYLIRQSWYRRWYTGLYVVVWGGISIGIEWLSLLFHVYIYKGWKLIYSMPVYLLVLSSTILFYHLIRTFYSGLEEDKEEKRA